MDTKTINQTPESDKGFTLIELLIVIVILGVLATVTVFAVSGITTRGEQSACDADKKTMEVAIEAYNAESGNYPLAESDLVPTFLRTESSNWDFGADSSDLVAQSATCGAVAAPPST